MKGNITSKGRRQRPHQVTMNPDGVYVQISSEKTTGEKLASDGYVSFNFFLIF